MRNWTAPDGEREIYNPLEPITGPISLVSFTGLLLGGLWVLAMLCSGLRDPAAAFDDWRGWLRGTHINVVDGIVGAILTPFPSANHTFQFMDWWFRKRWDMRWLKVGMYLAPFAYFAVAHYRYEGRDPLLVAGFLAGLTWLVALGYPKIGPDGRGVEPPVES